MAEARITTPRIHVRRFCATGGFAVLAVGLWAAVLGLVRWAGP